jgi:hypothetical protein
MYCTPVHVLMPMIQISRSKGIQGIQYITAAVGVTCTDRFLSG